MKLYNSLTRQPEEFTSLQEKRVTLYVCGITPYDTTHLGHAFTYISFDMLVRFLQFQNYTVTYTQNVTDINDRDNDILQRAEEQHTTWDKLSTFWTEKFLSDMHTLNWIMPTNYLYASEEIPHMIPLIEKIIKNGKAYTIHGGVYLDIEKVPDFGKLSKVSKEDMIKIAKDFDEDLDNPDKKHPLDITLWRPTSPNQPVHIPSFDSPWGKGRPGWHIECSAMAISSLGETIDIHGGGIDLIFPHHESEIAQSESGTGKTPFAKYWMHTGTVYIHGKKMSKSLGNLILVNDLLKKYSSNAIRWVLLSHHYREQWEYQEEEFEKAEEVLEKIVACLQSPVVQKDSETDFSQAAIDLLSDDLNSPALLQKLSEISSVSFEEARDIQAVLSMLGFKV